MKKIIIAGGGISGLVARYYLSRYFPEKEMILLEKKDRLGGCVASSFAPFFFERGPRTFKVSRGEALLKLIDEVGLGGDVVYSSQQRQRRYLWKGGRLHKVSFFSSLLLPMVFPLLKEWRQSCSNDEDETIASFAMRRLGHYATQTFFDPLTLGIFGGDIDKLSMAACFPELKKMEKEYGSLTVALWRRICEKQKTKKGLFTLKGGLQSLIDRLIVEGRGKIYLNTPFTELSSQEETVLALSFQGMRKIFVHDEKVQRCFDGLKGGDLVVVNVGYRKNCLKKKGFGYLVPSSEKEDILGVVFDSLLFPSQNHMQEETRLTVLYLILFFFHHKITCKRKRG